MSWYWELGSGILGAACFGEFLLVEPNISLVVAELVLSNSSTRLEFQDQGIQCGAWVPEPCTTRLGHLAFQRDWCQWLQRIWCLLAFASRRCFRPESKARPKVCVCTQGKRSAKELYLQQDWVLCVLISKKLQRQLWSLLEVWSLLGLLKRGRYHSSNSRSNIDFDWGRKIV